LSAACLFFLIQEANAADCRWFGRDAQRAIKHHVAALQKIEQEASDRLKGLDSRPFDFLRDEAKRTATFIGEPKALADEEELKRCRNWTSPIRRICAEATQVLVDLLGKHAATAKPEYDKQQYSVTIGGCEKLMDLKPLKSVLRGTG
jgi:hypothetical protein